MKTKSKISEMIAVAQTKVRNLPQYVFQFAYNDALEKLCAEKGMVKRKIPCGYYVNNGGPFGKYNDHKAAFRRAGESIILIQPYIVDDPSWDDAQVATLAKEYGYTLEILVPSPYQQALDKEKPDRGSNCIARGYLLTTSYLGERRALCAAAKNKRDSSYPNRPR